MLFVEFLLGKYKTECVFFSAASINLKLLLSLCFYYYYLFAENKV